MIESSTVDIALIDDNPDDMEKIISALQKINLANSLKSFSRGDEALAYLFSREFRLHLIILDLNSPIKEGLEILRQIRSNEQTKSLPVIMLVSSEDEKHFIRAHGLAVNSFIIKPFNFQSFSKAIADIGLYWKLIPPIPGNKRSIA